MNPSSSDRITLQLVPPTQRTPEALVEAQQRIKEIGDEGTQRVCGSSIMADDR